MCGEGGHNSLRVSVALAPTLIFTLVLAAILRARFGISAELFGGLLLYAALNTILPSLVLRAPFDVDPLEDKTTHPEDAIAEDELDSPPPRPNLAG